MQNEEQFASLSDAIKMAVAAELRKLFTALPAGLKTDGDGHTVTAQSRILGLVRQDDGTMKQQALPDFDTLPVHFAGGGKMVSTHPLKAGDDGIWLGIARAIDSWHQAGGQQAPIDAREHHLSDGVFLGGLRADPAKLKNVAPDSHQVRSVDGKVTTDHHPDNGKTTKVVDPSDTSSDPFNAATKYFESKSHPTAGNSWARVSPTKRHSISMSDAGIAMSVLDIPSGLGAGFGLTPGGGMSMPAGAAAGNIGALSGDMSGTLPSPTVNGVQLTALTVTTLPPAASNAGRLCYVTDATSLTNGSTVAGGGSQKAIVKCDGSHWIVLG